MFYWQSEPCHEFHNNLVLLRRLNYCTIAIEIFLEVDTYVGNEGSGKTEGQLVWFVYKQLEAANGIYYAACSLQLLLK